MSWRETPMVGFDLETTGIDVETDRVVTACVGWADPKAGTWSPVNWLLRQTQPIPEGATAVHGITTEQANAEGTDPRTGLREISDALHTYWAKGWPVCGFNLAYDLTLLDRELRRHGLEPLAIRGPVIDAFVVDKALDPYRKGSRKLTAVAAHHRIPLSEDDAHGAEADALAATRLAWVLVGHPDVPQDGHDLNDWQQRQYADQRTSFAAYLRRQGKHDDAANVASRTSWPMEPATTRKVA